MWRNSCPPFHSLGYRSFEGVPDLGKTRGQIRGCSHRSWWTIDGIIYHWIKDHQHTVYCHSYCTAAIVCPLHAGLAPSTKLHAPSCLYITPPLRRQILNNTLPTAEFSLPLSRGTPQIVTGIDPSHLMLIVIVSIKSQGQSEMLCRDNTELPIRMRMDVQV